MNAAVVTDCNVGMLRESAMHWAMQTAQIGEDAMAILARAQLYEEYVFAAVPSEASADAQNQSRSVR